MKIQSSLRKNEITKILCFIFALWIVSSCGGRNSDQIYVPEVFKEKLSLGLVVERPMLVSFGAGWCKPCRKEISLFNSIQKESSEELEVVGFLVEGDEYGTSPTEEEAAGFVDKDGERNYRVILDKQWEVFNSFSPREGKRLPFIVLIKRDLTVAAAMQNAVASSDEVEFRNWVYRTLEVDNKISEGNSEQEPEAPEPQTPEEIKPPVKPTPPPVVTRPSADLLGETFAILDWVELFGESSKEVSSLYQQSWKTALEENYFTEEEMPFSSGQLKFVSDKDEGITQTNWSKRLEDSMCIVDMEATLRGKFIRSTSQCIIIKDGMQ